MSRSIAFLASFALVLAVAACGKNNQTAKAALDDAVWKIAAAQAGPIPMAMLPRNVVPLRYRLTFTIDPTKPTFSGHDEIDVTFTQPRRALYLDGLDLNVQHASVRLASGQTIEARYAQVHGSGIARLLFADVVPAGAATLIFDYDAPFGRFLGGLYKVADGGDEYAFTQFESTDARRAFPSFDEPGFKTPFSVTVNAPIDDKVIANTPVIYDSSGGNGLTKTVFQPTNPLPTYLIALAVGPLDIVDGGDIPANPNVHRAQPIHLRGITAKGKGDRIRYALTFTPKIILNLENYFGIAYPFQKLDLLAVPDFAAGAMENAGAVTFRERLLLLDESSPLDQKRASLSVQAHELTHQWFGDLVTPYWWDDIWLNESFANWMESKASQAIEPDWSFDRERLESAIRVMDVDELPSAREIHQPVNSPDDIENSFDGITYDKGAAVLTMFESYLGPDIFNRGIHAYLTRFAGRNATAKDFVGTIAQSTNHPEIVEAFNNFIDQPGIPDLQTTLQCAPNAASAGVAQSMSVPLGRTAPQRSWKVPMCLATPAGARTCRLIDAGSATVALGAVCPAYVLPNAQGKGYYRFTMDEKGWAALIQSAPTLSPADQLTLFANVDAAVHAGQASAADLFNVIAALAPNAQWDLIAAMRDSLHNLRQKILANEDLASYQAFLRTHFAPRLAAIGYAEGANEAPAITLARPPLAQLLVEEARDPATITALGNAATQYLTANGASAATLAPDLLREALRAGILSNDMHPNGAPADTTFGDRLIAAYQASKDEYFRSSAIYAFAGSEDPMFLAKVIALMGQMRTGELRYVYQYMQSEPVARTQLWSWIKNNYPALQKRMSPGGLLRTPGILANACDAGARADVESFFRPKVAELPGVQRPLALAEEQIDRCIAFKQARGAEVESAIKAAK
jgi:alanyl aminopeptidase